MELPPQNGQEYRDQMHHTNLLEHLFRLQQFDRFCDISITVQDQCFQAHKCVLASASPYFNSLLKSNTKNLLGQQSMNVDCDEPHLFRAVLQYIYTGIIVINQSNIKCLIILAHTLALGTLIHWCHDYLEQNLTPYNCIFSLEIAKHCNLKSFEDIVYQKINANIDIVIESNEIKQLPSNALDALLKSPDLNIPNEQIFSLICNWISYKLEKRRMYLPTLLTFINWKVVDVNKVLGVLRNHTELQSLDLCVSILEALKESALPQDFLSGIIEDLKSNRIQPDAREEGLMQLAVKTVIDSNSDKQFPQRSTLGSYDGGPHSQEYMSQDYIDIKSHMYDRNGHRQPENYYSSSMGHAQSLGDIGRFPNNEYTGNSFPLDSVDQCFTRNAPSVPKKATNYDASRRLPNETMEGYQLCNNNLNGQVLGPVNLSDGLNSWRYNENLPDPSASGSFHCTDEEITEALGLTEPDPSMSIAPYPYSESRPEDAPSVANCDMFYDNFFKSSTEKILLSDSMLVTDQEESEDQSASNDAPSNIDPPQLQPKSPPRTENTSDHDLPAIKRRSYRLANREAHGGSSKTVVATENVISRSECKTTVTTIDEVQESKDPCDICGFEIADRRSFYSHMKTHFTGPPFACDLCSKKLKNLYHLTSHRILHFPNKKFKCSQCDYSSHRSSNLKEHKLIHRKERPHKCETCGDSFTRLTFLKSHQSKHTDVKAFVCDECGWKSKTKQGLNTHLKKHSGDLHKCTYENCTYESTRRSHLKDHLNSHTKIRAFKCEICPNVFTLKSHLNRHMISHDPSKQLACELCDYNTFRKESLHRHKRVKHSRQQLHEGMDRANTPHSPMDASDVSSNANTEDPDEPLMIITEFDEETNSFK